jgi:replicative DNA helicase
MPNARGLQLADPVDVDRELTDEELDAAERADLLPLGKAMEIHSEAIDLLVAKYAAVEERKIASHRHMSWVEIEVIAAAMSSPGVVDDFPVVLTAADFDEPKRALVWDALSAVRSAGIFVSQHSVIEELMRRAQLDEVGGPTAVATMAAAEHRLAEAPTNAMRVRNAAALRGVQVVAAHAIARAKVGDGDATAIVAEMVAGAERAVSSVSTKTTVHMPTLAAEVLDGITAISGKPRPVLSTGFHALDRVLGGGLSNGELIIVAARPSMGKTSLGLDLARNVAMGAGFPVAFFSMEMSAKQLGERMVMAHSGVNTRLPRMTDAQKKRLYESAGRLGASPIELDPTPAQRIGVLRSRIRQHVRKSGVRLVVIDYLQLADGDDSTARKYEQVSAISRGLKLAAAENGIPVVAISQLNRANEKREGSKKPELSDLRDSGALEQDADVIAFIHRPEYYLRERCPEEERRMGEIMVAKNRNGPTDTVRLRWDGALMCFSDMPE